MELSREYLPATGTALQELVLLHGWGCNREIWRPLLAVIRPWANVTLVDLPGCAAAPGDEAPSLEDLLRSLIENAPERAVYVGWSLGGQLALELAGTFPERVEGLVTICSNPRFIATGGWPGMAPGLFEAFRQQCMENPGAALKRFDSLQSGGAAQPRPLLRQLRAMRAVEPGDSLQSGLAWLADLDQRALLKTLEIPRIHIFGDADALVPTACAQRVAEWGPGSVETLEMSCHLLPLEAPAALATRLRGFLERHELLNPGSTAPPFLDKGDVAASFSRAAREYDSVAILQRDVGSRLLSHLDDLERQPDCILDLGCGTGHFLPELRARFPKAGYIGLDLAQGMVDFARERFPGDEQWLIGDAESLPLAADTVDLVFSSLAIQWCYRPELLFAELARVLRPGGICVFTSLGPETLKELRTAWAAVDEHQHVNSFLPPAELESAARRVPGIGMGLKAEKFSMRYRRVRDLLTELKTLGAHNVNRQRPSGLTGRRALQGMLDAYENWREDGLLPATYDVLFGVVEKS